MPEWPEGVSANADKKPDSKEEQRWFDAFMKRVTLDKEIARAVPYKSGEMAFDYLVRKMAYYLGLRSTDSLEMIRQEFLRRRNSLAESDPDETPDEGALRKTRMDITKIKTALETEDLMKAVRLESSIEGNTPSAQHGEQVAEEELGKIIQTVRRTEQAVQEEVKRIARKKLEGTE